MSGLKKQLRPHAATCIKLAIFERLKAAENAGLAYTVHCDRNDCWSDDELIEGYMCAVNVRQRGYRLDGQVRRTLSDKTVLCGKRGSLLVEIEVYGTGCEDETINNAMAVFADVSANLSSCSAGSELFARCITEESVRTETNTDSSDEKTRVVGTFDVKFDYMPCRPTLVFRHYKETDKNG
jgi:hypothetical protein